jgi:hypothetical protein
MKATARAVKSYPYYMMPGGAEKEETYILAKQVLHTNTLTVAKPLHHVTIRFRPCWSLCLVRPLS